VSSLSDTVEATRLSGVIAWLREALDPRSAERLALNGRRWNTLPASARTPQQAAGRAHVACGATHGVVERCNFACTACYLTSEANGTPDLPLEDVFRQIDELRRHLGPMGKVQITSGEVTLLEPEELGRIVAYARNVGLDPMLMTNGQRFVDRPGYLETLVLEYGLRKVAIHVDVTQRGRRAAPFPCTERSLRGIRDDFAARIRRVRRHTGRHLDAAHTVTVTRDNIDDVPDLIRWSLDHHDAFRMVSFQPVAEVGRTRDSGGDDLSLAAVWHRIREGVGLPLNRDALHFGHRACNIVCPLFVVSYGEQREIVECVPEGDRFGLQVMTRLLDMFGGLGPLRESPLRGALRRLLVAALHPATVGSALAYGALRAWWMRGKLLEIAWQAVRLRSVRVRPWILVVHKFMNPDELATPLGQERLRSCVFRVPVDGRMVSMCELNATDLRLRLNRAQRRRVRQATSRATAASIAANNAAPVKPASGISTRLAASEPRQPPTRSAAYSGETTEC
jgi:MoaA/NifB/PqqE/SkfB family radical SAM enzyme